MLPPNRFLAAVEATVPHAQLVEVRPLRDPPGGGGGGGTERSAISPRRTGARSVPRPPRPRPLPDMEGAGSPPFLKGGQTEPALESIQGTCLPSVPIRSGFEQKHRKVEEFPWVFPPVSTLRYPGSPTPVPSRGD